MSEMRKVKTHFEVRVPMYSSEPDGVHVKKTEAEARVLAMTIALNEDTKRRQREPVEVFEVETHEMRLDEYTKEGLKTDLTRSSRNG